MWLACNTFQEPHLRGNFGNLLALVCGSVGCISVQWTSLVTHPPDNDRLPREKREIARRARRLAHSLLAEDVRARLARFADELDMEAAALERSVARYVLAPDVMPQEQRQQPQVQQQQQSADSQARPSGARKTE